MVVCQGPPADVCRRSLNILQWQRLPLLECHMTILEKLWQLQWFLSALEHTEVEPFFRCLLCLFFFSPFFGAKQFWSVPYLGDLGDFKHFWWEDYPIWPQTYFQRATQAEKNWGKMLCLQLQKTCSGMPPAYCHGIWWGTYDEMAMVQDSWHGPQGITLTTCALKFGAQAFWPKVKSLKVEVEKKTSDISCLFYPHLFIFFKLLFQRCFHVDQTIWVHAMSSRCLLKSLYGMLPYLEACPMGYPKSVELCWAKIWCEAFNALAGATGKIQKKEIREQLKKLRKESPESRPQSKLWHIVTYCKRRANSFKRVLRVV